MRSQLARANKTFYIDAVRESAQRVRSVIYLSVTVSVIGLVAAVSTGPDNSLISNLEAAERALEISQAQGSQPEPSLPRQERDERELRAAQQFVTNYKGLAEGTENLKEIVQALRSEAIKHALMAELPFFGARVPVTNLTLFGGFAFAAILFVLRFVLARHFFNIKRVKELAEVAGQLQGYLTILEFYSVLTVPNDPSYPLRRLWRHIPLVALCMPVAANAYFVANEIRFSFGGYSTGQVVGFLLFGIVFLMTVSSVKAVAKQRRLLSDWRFDDERAFYASDSLAGTWEYTVTDKVTGYHHQGNCWIWPRGGEVEIKGERTRMQDSSESEVEETNDTWRAIWNVSKQNALFFEYVIVTGLDKSYHSGLCVLNFDESHLDCMWGEYYQLPPATNPRRCQILFSLVSREIHRAPTTNLLEVDAAKGGSVVHRTEATDGTPGLQGGV